MTENALQILIKLFAYVTSKCGNTFALLSKSHVQIFLSQQFSTNTVNDFLTIYDEELAQFEEENKGNQYIDYQIINSDILIFASDLEPLLSIKQRFLVLLSLIEFIKILDNEALTHVLMNSMVEVSKIFKISKTEFDNCRLFAADHLIEIENKKNILLFWGSKMGGSSGLKYSYKAHLKGRIAFLHIESINSYLFNVTGKDYLEVNGRHLFQRQVYFLQKGSCIRGSEISPIYYSDVEKCFIENKDNFKIHFSVEHVEFEYNKGLFGIKGLSLLAEPGQLVAIMGGSGTGKSTLLNILNGNMAPNSGKVCINGIDIHQDKAKIEGLIGYVPQDDMLFEELSVFENLYYNAKLCFAAKNQNQIIEIVNKTLQNIDLYDIKDLKVGSILNKLISGGQRKRLNIALELIREPYILFVDEPTSGLSSTDSASMLDLLKEQTKNGKLVFITIHQPSSEIFKLFDKLLVIDKGGFPVYWGNPSDAHLYFKTNLQLIDAEHNECLVCGNVYPEEILQLIEIKNIDGLGNEKSERKISAQQWFEKYQENLIKTEVSGQNEEAEIPKSNFKTPKVFAQFLIFITRNLISKFSDTQFVLISLLEAPVLALILGYLLRQTNMITHIYEFSKNDNLPSYLFMSIIVALFIGLIVSSEEIIKDRKILKREAFLNLNRKAYINSKVVYLFSLSFVQMLSFVLVGNFTLEIKGMTLSYLLILWSTACFANLLGLLISNGLKSVVSIYITIPFLLIPQILLAGIVVDFNKINYRMGSHSAGGEFDGFAVGF